MTFGRLASIAFLLAAGPARAECLGSCADRLGGALLALLVYGVLAIVVFVMLIRAKWRRGGVRLLVGVVLLAVGLPLLSQAWTAWKLSRTESREIVGTLPDLAEKTTLLLTDSGEACYYDACAFFVISRGGVGTIALPISEIPGLDLGQPLDLASLPLELWQPPVEGTGGLRRRALTDVERAEAVRRIDYLVVMRTADYLEDQGPVETALRQRPAQQGMRASERANIAMGPILGGRLDLVGMTFDLLDLHLSDRALALILAPYNTQDAGNTIANRDAVAAQICPEPALDQGWNDCAFAFR